MPVLSSLARIRLMSSPPLTSILHLLSLWLQVASPSGIHLAMESLYTASIRRCQFQATCLLWPVGMYIVQRPDTTFCVSGCISRKEGNAEPMSSDIAEATIGPRSRVATSPDRLEECRWELEADTENFIHTIEVCLLIPPRIVEMLVNNPRFRKLFTTMPGASIMCWFCLQVSRTAAWRTRSSRSPHLALFQRYFSKVMEDLVID